MVVDLMDWDLEFIWNLLFGTWCFNLIIKAQGGVKQ
jgi:hypothetical protein